MQGVLKHRQWQGCCGWAVAQKTPNSISKMITVIGTPRSQAMMGIVISRKMVEGDK